MLVHAAAGGTGQLLTQICSRHLDARVIGTTSTAEKAEVAKGSGAQEVGSLRLGGMDGWGLGGNEGVPACLPHLCDAG